MTNNEGPEVRKLKQEIFVKLSFLGVSQQTISSTPLLWKFVDDTLSVSIKGDRLVHVQRLCHVLGKMLGAQRAEKFVIWLTKRLGEVAAGVASSSTIGPMARTTTASPPVAATAEASGDEAWVKLSTADGRIYFWNRRSNTRAWSLPKGVLAKWTGQKNEDGRTYYWCKGSKPVWVLPPLAELPMDVAPVEQPLLETPENITQPAAAPSLAPETPAPAVNAAPVEQPLLEAPGPKTTTQPAAAPLHAPEAPTPAVTSVLDDLKDLGPFAEAVLKYERGSSTAQEHTTTFTPPAVVAVPPMTSVPNERVDADMKQAEEVGVLSTRLAEVTNVSLRMSFELEVLKEKLAQFESQRALEATVTSGEAAAPSQTAHSSTYFQPAAFGEGLGCTAKPTMRKDSAPARSRSPLRSHAGRSRSAGSSHSPSRSPSPSASPSPLKRLLPLVAEDTGVEREENVDKEIPLTAASPARSRSVSPMPHVAPVVPDRGDDILDIFSHDVKSRELTGASKEDDDKEQIEEAEIDAERQGLDLGSVPCARSAPRNARKNALFALPIRPSSPKRSAKEEQQLDEMLHQRSADTRDASVLTEATTRSQGVKVVKLLSRSARMSEAAGHPSTETQAAVHELETAPIEKTEHLAPHDSRRQATRSRSPVPSREARAAVAEHRAKSLAAKLTRRFQTPLAVAPQPRSPCVFDPVSNMSEEESAEASSIGRSCSRFARPRSQQKAKAATRLESAPSTPVSEEGDAAAPSEGGITTRVVTLKARKDREPKPHAGKTVGTWRQVFSRPRSVHTTAAAVSLQPDQESRQPHQEPRQDGQGILDKFMTEVMHGAPPGKWCPIDKSAPGAQACKSDGEKAAEPGRPRRLSSYGGA